MLSEELNEGGDHSVVLNHIRTKLKPFIAPF